MGSPATKELRDLLGSYRFFAEMQRLSAKASQGDPEAVSVLDSMLAECSVDPDWRVKSRWCSAAVRALVSAGTPEAMERVLGYVRALPEETPYGMIELLGGLVPAFGSAVVGRLSDLINSDSEAARAVGMQAYCTLALEGQLKPDELSELAALSATFAPDRYLTHHLIEVVQNQTSSGQTADDAELQSLLDDVIVEKE